MSAPKENPHWLEKRRTVNAIVHALWVVCALLLLAEFFYEGHPRLGFDGWFGFYAGFGFLSYCVIVLSAKQLRRLLQRPENYYNEGSDDDGSGHDG